MYSLQVGEHIITRLKELQQKHDIIGDVRGSGLMLGVELVKDRKTKEPAKDETAQVAIARPTFLVSEAKCAPYLSVTCISLKHLLSVIASNKKGFCCNMTLAFWPQKVCPLKSCMSGMGYSYGVCHSIRTHSWCASHLVTNVPMTC